MEKLSLKIQLSYVVYGILFYVISLFNYNQINSNSTDLALGLTDALKIALFWCTTNLFFLASLVITSLFGMLYSKYRNKEALKPFGFIFMGSSLLLLSIFLLEYL